MQTITKTIFWLALAVGFFWSLIVAFNVDPPTIEDLYKLKAGYEESDEQFHRQDLVDSMCEISNRMGSKNIPEDIKEFLEGRCL